MKKAYTAIKLFLCFSLSVLSGHIFGQEKETDRVKMEHEQIGIVEDKNSTYQHTTHPDAQWYPQAAFGMFIHWGISSIKEIDLSWPMMAGTQIGWRSADDRLSPDEVKKIMDSGDYFKGHPCQADNTCVTPNQYWDLAKEFNPKSYDPRKWAKAAKEAGMTYVVLTTKHHDGFALWPSSYGSFNTKNYMGGRDLVKEYVVACREYGLKVGLYYSGPDWHQNGDYQNFMYRTVGQIYPNIPELDANLQPRKTVKSDAEKQSHYKEMAVFVKGQIEELLTNYGKIDMIWFDGAPDIPKGNPAWNDCISMERIHELQPGIIVSPRFFGYGDYKTFEQDKSLPKTKQDGWAEFCSTVTVKGWGITKFPLKSTAHLIDYLIKSRDRNTNMLLNFGPTKDGVFTTGMNDRLREIAQWMKVNGRSIKGTRALDDSESASVPATAGKGHRYLFLLSKEEQKKPLKDEKVVFKAPSQNIKKVSLLGCKEHLKYNVENGTLTVQVPVTLRTELADVIDVELN